MLVDLPYGWDTKRSPYTGILTGPDYKPEHVAQGVYVTHYNFSNDIESLVRSDYPFSFHEAHDRHKMTEEEWEKAFSEWDWSGPADYGVCDRWEQIIERWPTIVTDPRRLIISLSEVRREDQPERGGWRWHKWGEYIGTDHEPKHEYLADEDPSIERVFCFHILELK